MVLNTQRTDLQMATDGQMADFDNSMIDIQKFLLQLFQEFPHWCVGWGLGEAVVGKKVTILNCFHNSFCRDQAKDT